jgi:hypothetical protein
MDLARETKLFDKGLMPVDMTPRSEIIIHKVSDVDYSNLSYEYDEEGAAMLYVDDEYVGSVEVFVDRSNDEREYVAINYTIVYLDGIRCRGESQEDNPKEKEGDEDDPGLEKEKEDIGYLPVPIHKLLPETVEFIKKHAPVIVTSEFSLYNIAELTQRIMAQKQLANINAPIMPKWGSLNPSVKTRKELWKLCELIDSIDVKFVKFLGKEAQP